jgi:hypothetical protein
MGRGLHATYMRSCSNEMNLTWTTYRTLSTQPFKLSEVVVFQRRAGHSSCIWGAKRETEFYFGWSRHQLAEMLSRLEEIEPLYPSLQ